MPRLCRCGCGQTVSHPKWYAVGHDRPRCKHCGTGLDYAAAGRSCDGCRRRTLQATGRAMRGRGGKPPPDLAGRRLGGWLVLGRVTPRTKPHHWWCRCLGCRRTLPVRGSNLTTRPSDYGCYDCYLAAVRRGVEVAAMIQD